MPIAPESANFQLSKGELKLDDLSQAVLKTLQGISPLAAVRAAVSPRFWLAVAGSVPDLLLGLVHLQISDVLTGAWKTHRKLQKYTDQKAYPPDRTATVPLTSHHITATQKPYLEIFVDGESQGKIEFELKLDVTVEEGILIIRNGRILRVEAARARATGTLKCAGVVVAERTTRDYAWASALSFGDGIQISG